MNARALPAACPDLESALDQLLSGRWAPAQWHRIHDPTELPWRFENMTCVMTSAWRAYSDGVRFGFAVAEFAGASPFFDGTGDVKVEFYEPDGRVCARGVWGLDGNGRWSLREIL